MFVCVCVYIYIYIYRLVNSFGWQGSKVNFYGEIKTFPLRGWRDICVSIDYIPFEFNNKKKKKKKWIIFKQLTILIVEIETKNVSPVWNGRKINVYIFFVWKKKNRNIIKRDEIKLIYKHPRYNRKYIEFIYLLNIILILLLQKLINFKICS